MVGELRSCKPCSIAKKASLYQDDCMTFLYFSVTVINFIDLFYSFLFIFVLGV